MFKYKYMGNICKIYIHKHINIHTKTQMNKNKY